MKYASKICIMTLAIILLFTTSSFSSIVDWDTDSSGRVTAIYGFEFDIYLTHYGPYDISWYYGYYNPDLRLPLFSNDDIAAASAQLVIDVNAAGGIAAYVYAVGSSSMILNDFLVSYSTLSSTSSSINSQMVTISNYPDTVWQINGLVTGRSNDTYRVWAAFTDSVPIPSAVWLLGSGLIGIVGIRRKYK